MTMSSMVNMLLPLAEPFVLQTLSATASQALPSALHAAARIFSERPEPGVTAPRDILRVGLWGCVRKFNEWADFEITGPEIRFVKGLPAAGIQTEAHVHQRLADLGFRHIRRGTFESKALDCYFYAKPIHLVRDLSRAREMLATAIDLTRRGVLFPGTRWGIYETADGGYQLFAVTRALKHPRAMWNTPDRLPESDKRLSEWLQRVPPGLQNEALNPAEAMHLPNWGWSMERRQWYPVDVEVIDFA
ncbi:MAG TPA: hypothetical protein VLJ37_07390 [bacterium]|nr:hypothetical protein [bacterium]